tara:strand:- start:1576 stop:1872 length:297 start_codon:yes stop_codon:yes gene_type:complete
MRTYQPGEIKPYYRGSLIALVIDEKDNFNLRFYSEFTNEFRTVTNPEYLEMTNQILNRTFLGVNEDARLLLRDRLETIKPSETNLSDIDHILTIPKQK